MVCYWPTRAQIIRDGRREPGGERVRLSLLAATPPISYYGFVLYFLGFPILFFYYFIVSYRVHAKLRGSQQKCLAVVGQIGQLENLKQLVNNQHMRQTGAIQTSDKDCHSLINSKRRHFRSTNGSICFDDKQTLL